MALDLFAGIPVSDYHPAKSWYERLLGKAPAFIPHATAFARTAHGERASSRLWGSGVGVHRR